MTELPPVEVWKKKKRPSQIKKKKPIHWLYKLKSNCLALFSPYLVKSNWAPMERNISVENMEEKPKMWFAVKFALYQHGPIIHLIASISGVLCYLLARTVKAKICIDRESFAEVWPLEMVGDGRKWLRLWGEQLRSPYVHSLQLTSAASVRPSLEEAVQCSGWPITQNPSEGNDGLKRPFFIRLSHCSI